MGIRAEERFAAKYEPNENGCKVWKGYIQPNGYGQFTLSGKQAYAHRFAYEQYVAPLEPGLVIDHLCRNRACVEPSHLRQVTQRENLFAEGSMALAKLRHLARLERESA